MSTFDILKELIEKYKVISFDVFDTALFRKTSVPRDIFRLIERNENLCGFEMSRVKAEVHERSGLNSNKKNEVSLNMIYENPEMLKYSPKLEEQYELENIYANEIILKLYKYAKSKGKKIIFTSDTYFSENFIRELLYKSGYNGLYDIFSSSDINLTKRDGSIFKYVLETLKIECSDIIHIGDNMHSDYIIPSNLGITSYYLQNPFSLYVEGWSGVDNFSSVNLQRSIIIKGIADYLYYSKHTDCKMTYWQEFGFKFAGPIVFAFVNWIYKQAENKFDDIIFVARDGYLLKEVFEYFYKNTQIKCHYIYAPRILNSLSSYFDGHSDDFNEDDIKRYIKNINYSMQTDFNYNTDSMRDLAKKFCSEYAKYINKIEFNHNESRIAVVDSAVTHFSSQKLLSKFLKTNLTGLYWWVPSAGNLLYDKYHYTTFQESHDEQITKWNLVEYILSSPEPPILTINSNKPVYKNITDYDKKRIDIFSQMRQGILKYVEILKNNHCEAFSNQDVTDYINLFCRYPNKNDIIHFKDVNIASGIDNGKLYKLNLFSNKNNGLNIRIKKIIKRIIYSHRMVYIAYYKLRTMIFGKY